MFISKPVLIAFVLVCLACVGGCGPKDPRTEVLEQRARWELTPQGFIVRDDGRLMLTVGVAGPARSTLDRLTFRIELRDTEGHLLAEKWHTLDLSAIPLGVGTDVMVDLGQPPEGFVLAGDPPRYGEISLDRVLQPDPEESRQIVELQF
jgi:hypothetical protein